MRRILSYAGFFALSGYALVDTESSYRAWIWIVMILLVFVMMLYDMFVHRKEIAEFLRAFPKFSALRYDRHAQDAGRYGRFTPARRSALDRFAVAALKIAYVLAVMASIFGLAVHFFSVKLGSKDILNIVFVVLGLCVIFLKVLHHRKTYLRWVRDKVIKR